MPRGKSDAKSKNNPNAGRKYYCEPDAPFGGYIDLKLDDDQHAAFDDWFLKENGKWLALLQDDVTEGLAFGSKWDASSQCFVATYSGCGITGSTERYVLTARASSFPEAMALLVYKHDVLMGRTWDDYKPSNQRLKAWG